MRSSSAFRCTASDKLATSTARSSCSRRMPDVTSPARRLRSTAAISQAPSRTAEMAGLRDDLDFLLYRWLGVDAITVRPRYAEHSRQTFDAILDTSERIARERFAPANRPSDVHEPTFDGARVHLPKSTAEALRAYGESGLLAAGHDYDSGGMQL